MKRFLLCLLVFSAASPVWAGGMGCSHGGGAAVAAPLTVIALAAGYGVWVLSQRQQRPLDVVGRVLGLIIVLASIIGLLCLACAGVSCWRIKGSCGAKAVCPMPLDKMDTGSPTPSGT